MNVYAEAARIFEEECVPHVCWAIALADGYDSRDFMFSPATIWFQHEFAALEMGAEILRSEDMLTAVGADGFREFSLMLLAMGAAIDES